MKGRHFSLLSRDLARAFTLSAVCAGVTAGGGAAQSPIASATVAAGTLSFDGHGSLGDFIGTTSTVTGELLGARELSSVRGWVDAPVRTLKTGNGKRDADLRKSLESDRYPSLRFELDSVTERGRAADTVNVVLHGKFVLHGVTRTSDVPAHLLFTSMGVRVRADTPLHLSDYRIGGLSKLLGVLKMHNVIEVHVDLIFTPR